MLPQAGEQFADGTKTHHRSKPLCLLPRRKSGEVLGFFCCCGCNVNTKSKSRGVECRTEWLGEEGAAINYHHILYSMCINCLLCQMIHKICICMLILIDPGFSWERVHFSLSSWYRACSVLDSVWSWNHNIISLLSFHSHDFTYSNNLLPLVKMGIRHLCEY